jgi:dimeric dUTPase (all-alpha-NTP-PPase superfamily)
MTLEQLKEMFQKQEELNEKYSGKEWKEIPNSKFGLAVFTEVAEYLESNTGVFKWWKPATIDKQNSIIEIVDVWHFGMSLIIKNEEEIDFEYMMKYIDKEDKGDFSSSDDLLNNCTDFLNTLMTRPDDHRTLSSDLIYLMTSMMQQVGIDWDTVYNVYAQKNALNHKRVEGGYMTGDYVKVDAEGNEDNRAIQI